MKAPTALLCLLLSIPAARALTVGGRLQLANGLPVSGPASLHIEQIGGELGPWSATAAADGTWSTSDPLLFGNLRITGTLAGHTIPAQDFFVESNRSNLNITCVTLTPVTTLPPVVTASGTTLSGIVGPQSQARSAVFEWGFTTDYGNVFLGMPVTPSSANAFPSIVLPSTQVPPGRTVHYRLRLGAGPSAPAPPDAFGGDQSFVQPFNLEQQTVLPAGMSGVRDSRAAWADFDANGRMDIVFAGSLASGLPTARVIRFGSGPPVAQTLGAFGGPALAVADANRDGFADVLLAGSFANQNNAGQIIKFFTGGPGSLTDSSIVIQGAGTGDNFLGTTGGAAAFVDFHSTGAPGYALTGLRNNQPHAEARLQSGGAFSTMSVNLPASVQSIVQPVHADRDGRADLLIGGSGNGTRSLALLQNKFASGGGFTAISDAGLPAVDSGDAVWADSDADGDMDVLVTGATDSGALTKLFLNDGEGHFTDSGAAFTQVQTSAAAWGDVDADGDPDLVIQGFTGFPANQFSTVLYFNQGGNVFTPVPTSLPRLRRGSVSWGFADTDSTLDLLVTGEREDFQPFIGVWNNPYTPANTPPSPPPAASLRVSGSVSQQSAFLTFEWGQGSDATTPAAALTYNVRIGTSPGAGDLFSGNAAADRSRTLFPAHGQMQTQFRLSTGMIRPGIKYFWSVQSVDAGYAVSPWVDGQTVIYGFNELTSTPVSPASLAFSASIPPNIGEGEYAFEFSLPEDQLNPSITPFVRFNSAGTQALTLSQLLTGLLPGRTYFVQLILRFDQNVYRAPILVARTPREPEIVSLQFNAGNQSILRYLAASAPAPVVEISTDLNIWQTFPGGSPVSGGELFEFITPAPFNSGARAFYRVRTGP